MLVRAHFAGSDSIGRMVLGFAGARRHLDASKVNEVT